MDQVHPILVIRLAATAAVVAACTSTGTNNMPSSAVVTSTTTATSTSMSTPGVWVAERLAISQAFDAVFSVCPNPTNDRPAVVIRPPSLDGCKPAIENVRSIAVRIQAELPQFEVSEQTRADIRTAVTHLFEHIDHFEEVELHGTDAEVINEHFDVNEFRLAGR